MEAEKAKQETPEYYRFAPGYAPALLRALCVSLCIPAGLFIFQKYFPAGILWPLFFFSMLNVVILGLTFYISLLRKKYHDAENTPGLSSSGSGDVNYIANSIELLGNSIQYVVILAAGLLLAFAGYSVLRYPAFGKLDGSIAIFTGAVCVFSVFLFIIGSRYFEETAGERLPESTGLAQMFRSGIWMAAAITIIVVLHSLGYKSFSDPVHKTISGFLFLAGLELAARGLKPVFNKRKSHSEIVIETEYVLTGLFTAGSNPLESLGNNLERWFGVNFKDTWAIHFVKKSLMPIVLLILGIAWLWTSVVMVTLYEEGILLRFGKPLSRETLKPGLHIVYPWPIDRVTRLPVSRVNVMGIGYEESKVGASLLWTKAHAVKEYSLLIGNGRDLVSVNAELAWKIDDAYDFMFNTQNPEQALQEAAYRILLFETVGKDLDGMLSENVEQFGKRVKSLIQEAVDRDGLGIEVTGFYLKGLHPPVDVAEHYQAVESARIDKKKTVTRAYAYRLKNLPRAESVAVNKVTEAESFKLNKRAEATGQAVRFETLNATYSASPDLYRLRARLEMLEESLSETNVYIIDERLLTPDDPAWVDFRK